MDWPSNSPDLNSIENLWSPMLGKDQAELKKFMKEEWEKIPNSTLSNLVDSMKKRCELVIEKNGERIPY